MNRRALLASVAGAGATVTAGCLEFFGGDNGLEDSITVATYESFVDGDDPIGPWLKSEFEAEFDTTVEFEIPDAGINQYIRRIQQDAPIDTDLFIGLNVDELIRIDQELSVPMFESVDGSLDRDDQILDELRFDPDGRAIPYDTGYISLVYDESHVQPSTFQDLTDPAYAGELITQNAQQSDPGAAFLLWTIHEYGPDGYLDYWHDLVDNDVRILGSWSDAYNAYLAEEAAMVVSYSTDQVFASQDTDDLTRHQIGFLNDQGYANPEGMARFTDAPNPTAATTFMEFMLRPAVQGEIAMRNVQFPAVDDAELDASFEQYAHVPPEPVTFTYDDLAGNLEDWIESWARQIAQ